MTRRNDPLGSIGWTGQTGGVLTTRECVELAMPLLRGELGILAGRLALALRLHSGRRATIEPARLAPPGLVKQVPRGRAWYLHRFAVTDLSIRMAPFN